MMMMTAITIPAIPPGPTPPPPAVAMTLHFELNKSLMTTLAESTSTEAGPLMNLSSKRKEVPNLVAVKSLFIDVCSPHVLPVRLVEMETVFGDVEAKRVMTMVPVGQQHVLVLQVPPRMSAVMV